MKSRIINDQERHKLIVTTNTFVVFYDFKYSLFFDPEYPEDRTDLIFFILYKNKLKIRLMSDIAKKCLHMFE